MTIEMREVDENFYALWESVSTFGIPSEPGDVDYFVDTEGEATGFFPTLTTNPDDYREAFEEEYGEELEAEDRLTMGEWKEMLDGRLESKIEGPTSTESMGRGNQGGEDDLR